IGKTYYNGRPTIANKCKFIKENDYAGVMIWQLFQDAHNDNYDLKLINVVGREMME
ncbi:chitinase, partial [Bacteroides thetaiotaomicron]